MKNSISNFFTTIPTALAGLALGIASLGWCWESAANLQGQVQMGGAVIASFLLTSLLLKFVFNPSLLKQDLAHHLSGSIVPTFSMALMVVANNINHFNHSLALLLWLVAILLHLSFLVTFIYYRVQDFKFEHILPSWFIPPVGIVVAVVSFPGGDLLIVANSLLMFGLVAYAILLPTMLYRYFFHSKIADHEKPTITVFAAPASLTLAGYLTITEQPNPLLVLLLACIALMMTLFIYVSFSKLLRLPFTPAYSAFTFPLVIGATAMFKTSHYLLNSGYDMQLVKVIESIAYGELFFATLMVAYVCLRYLIHFFPVNVHLRLSCHIAFNKMLKISGGKIVNSKAHH
ncbi:TDT family transporter [Psychromonas hadalis]|uniref:TDT family transporter n=1 Tax=Psychromonas hadalis TaxID=211669 RepID=UPI0003B470FE|nr:TDT family transporter [Psychromonas hadalis]